MAEDDDHGRARADNFVDAAFAFAVTLLVIAVGDPPRSLDDLRTALLNAPAFAGGFALIALFWWAHHSWAALRPRRDARSLLLSLAIVFVILVYVFPLRLLMQTGLSFMTGGWLPGSELVRGREDLRLLYVIYGVGFSTLGLLYAGLYAHAARTLRAEGAANRAVQAAESAGSYLILLAAGVLSTALAALLPLGRNGWLSSLPGFAYCLIGPANGLYWGWWVKRPKRLVVPESAERLSGTELHAVADLPEGAPAAVREPGSAINPA
jgi:hypothetical protein